MLINAVVLSTINGCVEDLFNAAYNSFGKGSPFNLETDKSIKNMVLDNFIMGAYVTATNGGLDRYMVEKFVLAVNDFDHYDNFTKYNFDQLQTLMVDAFIMGMSYGKADSDVANFAKMMKV